MGAGPFGQNEIHCNCHMSSGKMYHSGLMELFYFKCSFREQGPRALLI